MGSHIQAHDECKNPNVAEQLHVRNCTCLSCPPSEYNARSLQSVYGWCRKRCKHYLASCAQTNSRVSRAACLDVYQYPHTFMCLVHVCIHTCTCRCACLGMAPKMFNLFAGTRNYCTHTLGASIFVGFYVWRFRKDSLSLMSYWCVFMA